MQAEYVVGGKCRELLERGPERGGGTGEENKRKKKEIPSAGALKWDFLKIYMGGRPETTKLSHFYSTHFV